MHYFLELIKAINGHRECFFKSFFFFQIQFRTPLHHLINISRQYQQLVVSKVQIQALMKQREKHKSQQSVLGISLSSPQNINVYRRKSCMEQIPNRFRYLDTVGPTDGALLPSFFWE